MILGRAIGSQWLAAALQRTLGAVDKQCSWQRMQASCMMCSISLL